MNFRAAIVVAVAVSSAISAPAHAVYQCGNQKDDCKCGMNNIYPCCSNGSNCTWWAWESSCCNWGLGLPNFGNANTWAQNGKKNPNLDLLGGPVPGSIATSTQGTYGHVAWVTGVSGSKVNVTEMNCCPNCKYGMISNTHNTSYFNSGFLVKKGSQGPKCGDGSCNNGENCASCSQDCGGCCGNGKCDNGENCASCGKDCGGCCGNGACDNGENPCSCKQDCGGPCCGDGQCNGGENCSSCQKDCGKCCGNGKCDFGENCSSCEGDCGKCCGNGACDFGETCKSCNKDCQCMPVGSLDLATCSAAMGWAEDEDTNEKVQVKLKVAGEVQASIAASGPHPTHGGFGFSWPIPPQFKDGKPREVTADALDTQTGKATPLGPKAFLCENRTTAQGIWLTSHQDAAGLFAQLAPGGPGLGIQHAQPAGYPYPVSGVTTSCTKPGLEPFDEGKANAAWQLGNGQQQAALLVDGKELRTWQGNDGSEAGIDLGAGDEICLRSKALAQLPAAGAAGVTLGPIELRRALWRYTYAADAAGMTLGVPHDDALQFATRLSAANAPDKPVPAAGWLKAWRELPEPFDEVTADVSGNWPATARVQVAVGGAWQDAVAGALKQVLPPQNVLALRFAADDTLPPGAEARVTTVRVHRSTSATAGRWKLERLRAWGLDAAVPSGIPATDQGLAIDVLHKPAGWWTTGAVRATLPPLPYAVDRVRATVALELPEGLRFRMTVDGTPAYDLAGPATRTQVVDGAGSGHTVSVELEATQDRPDLPPRTLTVRQLQWRAGPWWTALSPGSWGVGDDRLGPSDAQAKAGARLEVAPASMLGGKPAKGFVIVHRGFDPPQTGLRLRVRQDLHPAAVRAAILLDGAPSRVLDAAGLHEEVVVQEGVSFKELGVALQVLGEGVQPPAAWWLEVTDVETRGADGTWSKVETVAQPDPTTTAPGLDAQGPETTVKGPASAAPSVQSGCSAGSSGKSTSSLLILVVIGLAFGLRNSPSRRPAA